MRYPQMDGLSWKIPLKRMIWGSPISGNLHFFGPSPMLKSRPTAPSFPVHHHFPPEETDPKKWGCTIFRQ